MRWLLLMVLLVTGGCIGERKALCMDIQEGGNAHVEFGYVYDEVNMTITGPIKFATVPDDALTHPCLTQPMAGP